MSVEKMIKTLMSLKKRTDALEASADELRSEIQSKEDEIYVKEKERESLDKAITNETAEHEAALQKMNAHLDNQTRIIEDAQKLFSDLKNLNETN